MSLSIKNQIQEYDPEKRFAYLSIAGMGCSNCGARIQAALISIQGVSDVIIDHQAGLGQVTYDPQLVLETLLVQTVNAAGNDGHHHYEAQLIEFPDW